MEFIDGETLSEYIHRQSLSLERILELGIQIADALDVAHTPKASSTGTSSLPIYL